MNARRRSGRDVRAMARPRPLELDRYDLAAAVQIGLPLGDAPASIRPMPSQVTSTAALFRSLQQSISTGSTRCACSITPSDLER